MPEVGSPSAVSSACGFREKKKNSKKKEELIKTEKGDRERLRKPFSRFFFATRVATRPNPNFFFLFLLSSSFYLPTAPRSSPPRPGRPARSAPSRSTQCGRRG